jgi:uncharacterized protein YjiS (DUF1127 family)
MKNHPFLEVFADLNLHAAEKEAVPEGGKTMILLNSSSGYPGRAYVRRRFRPIGRWFFSLVNGWVAAFIARREYQATLAVLRGLSDRELRDMGLYRDQAGSALEDAARYRTSRQHPGI